MPGEGGKEGTLNIREGEMMESALNIRGGGGGGGGVDVRRTQYKGKWKVHPIKEGGGVEGALNLGGGWMKGAPNIGGDGTHTQYEGMEGALNIVV